MDGKLAGRRRWMTRVLQEAQEAERALRPVWARQHRPERAAKARGLCADRDGDRPGR